MGFGFGSLFMVAVCIVLTVLASRWSIAADKLMSPGQVLETLSQRVNRIEARMAQLVLVTVVIMIATFVVQLIFFSVNPLLYLLVVLTCVWVLGSAFDVSAVRRDLDRRAAAGVKTA